MKYVICPNCKTKVELPRCELCTHLDLNDRKSIGYKCNCQNKDWPHKLSMYKHKNQIACQFYVADLNIVNQNTGDVVK